MRVLVVTNMYPSADRPWSGVFVQDQVESLKRLGLDVDVFLVDGPKNRINYAIGIPRLWKQLIGNSYDLLHAHYVYSGIVARAQPRLPVVLTHHGPEVFMFRNQAALCRMVTPWFDEVLVMSQEMKDKLGYPDAHIIPCGVDMDRFQPTPYQQAREALGMPLDKKIVLWAGDPRRPEKRFELVTEAVGILQKDDPSIELILLSGKAHGDVSMYMSAADVLLLTSDAEGSPMVVKEAMACNLPVVATPTGDVEEIIGATGGCYVCTQDVSDIVEKTRLVLDQKSRTSGRKDVERFDLEAIARRIVGVYDQALGGKQVQDRDPVQLASRPPQ